MIVVVRSLIGVLPAVFVFTYIFKKKQLNPISLHLVKSLLTILSHCSLALVIALRIKNWIMVDWDAIFILISSGLLFYIIIIAIGKLFKINYLEFVKLIKKNQYCC